MLHHPSGLRPLGAGRFLLGPDPRTSSLRPTARIPAWGPSMTDLAHPDRLAKVAAMREAGADPYPARGLSDATPVEELLAGAGTPDAPGPLHGKRVCAAGRLLGLRDFGKLIFAPLRDRTGRLQTGLKKDALSEWWPRRKWLDGGDLVGVRGELGFTQKGEPTIWADEVHLLSKAVAPPPEKWHGMSDTEARYRRRYVDLWANPDVLETFVARGKVLSTIRRFLEGEGYIEVETPTLHPLAGGAAARPFVTHHNARTRTSPCGSHPSCTSSDSSSAAWSACARSPETSATRASAPGTTPSSPCSSCMRRRPTTAG